MRFIGQPHSFLCALDVGQIEEISGPSAIESRLVELEESVETFRAALIDVTKDRQDLQWRLKNTLFV